MISNYNIPVSVGHLVKKPRFLLIGVMGVFNYGGEGIIRGTIRMLRERWPGCSITYATGFPEVDNVRLSDIEGLSIVQARERWTVKRVVFGIARRLGIGKGSPLPLKRSLINNVDVMLSIGGDNYALSPDNQMQFTTAQLMSLGDRALRKGKVYVLWGASVGPFDANLHAKKLFERHLQKISLITVRETVTLNYLKSLGCERNVLLVADPAFLMPPTQNVSSPKKNGDELLIAINLSPLSIVHVFGGDQQEFDRMRVILVASVRKILAIKNARILLVPHVVPTDQTLNDDYAFLGDIYEKLKSFEEKVTLLPRDLGGPATKSILSKCDVVVSARMHCCIAALSAGVPTLLIQYSQKAIGMARYVYGHDKWCMHLLDINPETFYRKVVDMLENRQEISNTLKKSRPKWEDEARLGVKRLGELL